jgi:hypothetical protein
MKDHGGTKIIYTKGVDRITIWYHNLMDEMVIGGGDELWHSFEEKIFEFVNENGGQTTIFAGSQKRAFRPNWADVRNKLKSGVSINHVSCF